MPFAVGDRVGMINHHLTRRLIAGPWTVLALLPNSHLLVDNPYYAHLGGYPIGENYLVPWTDDTVLGQIQPGHNPPPIAPGGLFAIGQQVRRRQINGGYSHNIDTIVGGPYLINGVIQYEIEYANGTPGMNLYGEQYLQLAAPAAVAAAAPANIYAGVPHEGVRNVPNNAENAIFMNAIAPGTEMVDFHDEAGHSRYYTLDGFRQLPMKMFPGVGRFKENPHTRQPIRPGNVTRYRKTGGRRRRKGAVRKNRRTHRR